MYKNDTSKLQIIKQQPVIIDPVADNQLDLLQTQNIMDMQYKYYD